MLIYFILNKQNQPTPGQVYSLYLNNEKILDRKIFLNGSEAYEYFHNTTKENECFIVSADVDEDNMFEVLQSYISNNSKTTTSVYCEVKKLVFIRKM